MLFGRRITNCNGTEERKKRREEIVLSGNEREKEKKGIVEMKNKCHESVVIKTKTV